MSESEVEKLLGAFDKHIEQIRLFRAQLVTALGTSSALEAHIHSIRSWHKGSRASEGKAASQKSKCKAEGLPFDVTPENMLETINDLAGVRILHLHTRQIRDIDHVLREIFAEQQYELREGPFARTWDGRVPRVLCSMWHRYSGQSDDVHKRPLCHWVCFSHHSHM